eukprot:CAMPEP_0176381308 /NCGR_PEP_ID=MMETSP0126-20121128/31784_1 /TAXON_ID=141414 ORGANISM="Strombidinopsis acuminatum, Strain SPMC142" /NCGR_SAMPLE_ID=MMETSP0126 /ASSEMBLY_ACC=CAM_ASM_000229 /LENGTH=101 /DNA_ID=CAMNT_0017745067 /DNA_START=94 /DNA_END=399 /DNA_ORIENTATION=+
MTKWKYVYPIEAELKRRFAKYGESFYVCRSFWKDEAALLSTNVMEEKKDASSSNAEDQETSAENTPSKFLNYCMISGCMANSVVKDDNELVNNIRQQLRSA